jgi:uncharacterized protein with FMN-binding domain
MAGLARRLAPAAALGGLAVVIVGVADPAIAGRTDAPATGESTVAQAAQAQPQTQAQPDTQSEPDPQAQPEAAGTCDNGEQVTGDAAMTRWGPVQVTATVAGGQVCQVQAISWPSDDRKSQQINAYAVPQLDAMATASPTQFDYVSGATYTSMAYHDSLQSILDSL